MHYSHLIIVTRNNSASLSFVVRTIVKGVFFYVYTKVYQIDNELKR